MERLIFGHCHIRPTSSPSRVLRLLGNNKIPDDDDDDDDDRLGTGTGGFVKQCIRAYESYDDK